MSQNVFLPKTDFPMRGNMPEKEVGMLEHFKGLYETLRDQSKGRKKFILHYGPPYANGHIHIGHVFSFVLKDIVNKTYQMLGYDAPAIPGWDCHGLPIEWQVEEIFRKEGKTKDDVIAFRKACREFAQKWVDIQREEFKRLGIIADWDHPYVTMDFETEGNIIEQIHEFVFNDTLYRGFKPVLWSVVEQTALADNEVEYKDITSDSLYVAFPLKGVEHEYAVIWTTTPWSLPGNRAIAYGEHINYVRAQTPQGKTYILAKDCFDTFKSLLDQPLKIVKEHVNLKGVVCRHPLDKSGYDFDVPLLPADHVSVDTGTGLVHTAPCYGVDDFNLGRKYNLEIPSLITDDGVYLPHVPLFGGYHIFKVGPIMIKELYERHMLLHAGKITHSYPHSWRSKKPLIYRTTDQWFIDIEKTGIRQKALESIEKVNWFPATAKNRIKAMIESRPDWCISRQRLWGSPIAIFIDKRTGDILRDPYMYKKVVEMIKEKGCDIWFELGVDAFGLDPDIYEKVMDIVDVWFESGSSHFYVLRARPGLAFPADLYLEGSDQHRGWFQTSLLESIGTEGLAPFKNVLTHGFALDEHGRKMSKSVGNVVAPQKVIDQYGADVLRQWTVFCDYTEDTRIGSEMLKRQEEIYRRFRNTLRYLLGALHAFDSEKKVAYETMPSLEQYILHELSVLDRKHTQAIKNYSFNKFYTDLHHFCNGMLSSFYFDIRKDCLYCDSLDNPKRLAYCTVLDILFNAIVRWLAPVLSFTAEEAYRYYDSSGDSIHTKNFFYVDPKWHNQDLASHWEELMTIRDLTNAELEKARENKLIKSGLEASVVLHTPVTFDPETLCEITITSGFDVRKSDDTNVDIVKAQSHKCERCWKIFPEVEHNLCKRCQEVVGPAGLEPATAPL